MNRIVLLMLISLLSFSCKDDEKINTEIMSVSNITYEQKPGGVLFKWDNPETDLSYVEILYKKDVGQENLQRIIVAYPENEQLIYGLPDANERDYTFIAHQGESRSTPTLTTAAAGEPPYNKLGNSLNVITTQEGVKVTWENDEAGEYYIEMFIDSVKLTPDYEIVVKETGKGERHIPISGVLTAEMHFITSDVYANKSNSIVRTYKKLENGWFDRSIWSFIVYPSQWDASVAPEMMLDGSPVTAWHTAKGSNSLSMHNFALDLKRKVKIEKVMAQHRPNSTNVDNLILFGSNDYNGAQEFVEEEWTNITTMVMKRGNSVITLKELETLGEYRYVWVKVMSIGNNYGVLAEFALYGEDIVDEN